MIPQKEEAGQQNFREMDWDKFRKSLEMRLGSIPGLCVLINEAQFQRVVNNLTQVIQLAIEDAIPISWPSPHSHRWWNKDLS